MKPKLTFTDISKFLNSFPQAVHKKIKDRGIKYHQSSKTNYLTHDEAREFLQIKVKPSIISFELVKGGVGKTSLSFHCAVRASLYGLKCAIIDLDQQANLTRAFGINETNTPLMINIINDALPLKDNLIKISNGLDLLPSGFENAMLNTALLMNKLPLDKAFEQIYKLKESYDLIFIDCPPDLGAAITAAALVSDLIIAPIEPDRFSLSGLELTLSEINKISNLHKRRIPVRIILNKFNSKTNLSHQTLSNLFVNEKTRDLVLKTFIAANQDFPNAFDKNISLFDTCRQSQAKNDIDTLLKELIEIIKAD